MTTQAKPKVLFIMVLRQAAVALPLQLAALREYNRSYNPQVEYLFVENSSTDDTPGIIDNHLKENSGYYVKLGPSNEIEAMPRISRIAKARNHAKTLAANFDFDLAVVIDADIYFDAETINRLVMFSFGNNSLYHCGFGVAALINHETAGISIRTANHYYDTATFLHNDNSKSIWPKCCFTKCLTCNASDLTTPRLPSEGGIIEVAAAFGGIAVIHAKIIHDKRIFWDPLSIGGSPLNEHLGLLCKMKELFKANVTIDLDAKVFWNLDTLNLN